MTPTISIAVSELKQALSGLKKVVSRSCLPVLGSIRINRNDRGEVLMQATDLDSFVQYRIPSEVEDPVEFLVPIQHLVKVVKACGSKESIEFVHEGPESIYIRTYVNGLGFEEKVETIPIQDWPAVPQVNGDAIVLDEIFRSSLLEAAECWSEDINRYIINSVHLDVSDPNGHYLVATDGKLLFSANSFSFGLKESLTIPRSKFLTWSGWWEKEAQLSVEQKEDHTWLKLQSGMWTFITRHPEGAYPNWRQVVPQSEGKTSIDIPSGTIEKVLGVVGRLPGDDAPNSPIDLKVSKKELVLAGGKTEVTIREAEVQGESVNVHLNRYFLAKALRFGLTHIEIEKSLSPLVFSNQGKRLVVMPIRAEATEEKPAVEPEAKEPAQEPQPEPATAPIEEQPPDQSKPTETLEERTAMTETETQPSTTLEKVEAIKEAMRLLISMCNNLITSVKAEEKERKASQKEIQTVREKLAAIKSVEI